MARAEVKETNKNSAAQHPYFVGTCDDDQQSDLVALK